MMNLRRGPGSPYSSQQRQRVSPQSQRAQQPKLAKCEAVQVVVRCRPMSAKEESQGHTQIVDMWPQRGIVHITNPRRCSAGTSGRMFTFDSVYDWDASQDDLYVKTVRPLVYSVLDGYNGTIFAYGQTGTGKTYTMLGSHSHPEEKGITSKCFEDIFRHIAYSSDHTSFVVRASYLEIYQEEARDLLSPDVCRKPLREDVVRGVYVKGLQSVVCKNIKAIERVMRTGNVHRATAATNMNEHSSRSHAIFQITIEMQDKAALHRRGHGLRVGKLNLVDLAGSERQCKTGAVGERLKESGKINLSLSALGNVISALVDGRSSHIPYRDSKLTQLLQDSLGGNSKSIMIANIGPASYNYDESLMTLRYASRAKHIKNKPARNVNPLKSVLSHYRKHLIQSEGKAREGERPGPRGDAGTTAASSTEDSSGSGGSLEATCRRRRCPWSWMYRPRASNPHAGRRQPRPQRHVVWKLHGKYHQETTVKMVRWIQEQMNYQPRARASQGRGQEQTTTMRADRLTEAELGVQRLVDDLSDAVLKERMLLSIAQMSAESEQQNSKARAFLKLASELSELRQQTEKQHRRQRSALVSEEARLRKELALRSTVFRAYATHCKSAQPAQREHSQVPALSDARAIPTLGHSTLCF